PAVSAVAGVVHGREVVVVALDNGQLCGYDAGTGRILTASPPGPPVELPLVWTVVAGRPVVVAYRYSRLSARDVATMELVREVLAPGPVTALAADPAAGPSAVVAVCGGTSLERWDLSTSTLDSHRLPVEGTVHAVAATGDRGPQYLVGDKAGT